MGNLMSSRTCACFNGSSSVKRSAKSTAKAVRIVHPGEGRVLERSCDGGPIKVAELMLEYPGHFVSELINNDQESQQGCAAPQRAIRPLPADYEATQGRVYILFPMHRLGQTRVAAQEYDSYIRLLGEAGALKKRKQGAASSKVVPLLITAMSLNSASRGEEAVDKPAFSHSTEEQRSTATAAGVRLLRQDGDSESNGASSNYDAISLIRSKSWIPRLETIIEGSVLAVP